ncbi:MAG: hypothetical protein RL272_104 [Candidatus Parcubacteria bacterium]|jgi:hypothetical protein
MKTLYTVIATLFLSIFVVKPAMAQSPGGSGPLPEVRVALPPALAQCVAACTAAAASPRPADHAECAGVTDTAQRDRIERMAREVGRLRSEVDAHTRSLAGHERRIRALEEQVGLLRDRNADLERQLREQRDAVAGIRRDLDALRRQYDLLLRDYVDLAVRVGVLEDHFRETSATLTALDGRISSIESRMVSIRFGVRTGPLVLGAFDGTLYTGWLVAPQLTFQLTPSVRVMAEAGVPLSISSSPVGTYVRGSAAYDFTPNWSIEAGLSSTWTGYNSRLQAKSAWLMGDVGARFSYRWFNVSANFMAGSEFDQGPASPALGGMILFGGEFPR